MWTYYISKTRPGVKNSLPKKHPQTFTDASLVQLLVMITKRGYSPKIVRLDWNNRWKRLRMVDDKGSYHDLRWKEDE